MMGHENHVFDDDEPLYEQIRAGMVFVTRDGGHVVRVTRVNEVADEITLTCDSNGETEVRSADEMWMFWDQEAFAQTEGIGDQQRWLDHVVNKGEPVMPCEGADTGQRSLDAF